MAQESQTVSPGAWQRPWARTEEAGSSAGGPVRSARVAAFEGSLPLLFPGGAFLAVGLYLLIARIPLYAGHEPLAILLVGVGLILLIGGSISWFFVDVPVANDAIAEQEGPEPVPAYLAPVPPPTPEPWVEEPGTARTAPPPSAAPVAAPTLSGPDPIEELLASIDVLHQASSDPESPGAPRWRTPDFSGVADREPDTGETTGRVARCVACRRRLTEPAPARCQSCELDMCAACAREARDEGRAGFCPTCAMLLEGSNEV